ncbi:MAG: hypothetical protein ACTHM2_06520 [Afipia sp.]
MIVLSLLVTDNLSGIDETMAQWAGLRAIEEDSMGPRVGRCHVTGQRTLHRAMAWLMKGDERGLYAVEVDRSRSIARIVDQAGELQVSLFGKFAGDADGINLIARYSALFELGQQLEAMN